MLCMLRGGPFYTCKSGSVRKKCYVYISLNYEKHHQRYGNYVIHISTFMESIMYNIHHFVFMAIAQIVLMQIKFSMLKFLLVSYFDTTAVCKLSFLKA